LLLLTGKKKNMTYDPRFLFVISYLTVTVTHQSYIYQKSYSKLFTEIIDDLHC
jgi:hypothetical protein